MISEDPSSNETLQKSSYALILPYMDHIAPYIVTRFSSQLDLLGEACRVMSIAPIDFIGINLSRTLPELSASYDQKALELELIAKELSTKAPSLLLKHSYGILAHIFLSNQATTTKALNFVIKVLTDATSSVNVIFLILGIEFIGCIHIPLVVFDMPSLVVPIQ